MKKLVGIICLLFVAIPILAACSGPGGTRIDPGYEGIFINYAKGTPQRPDMHIVPTGEYVTYNPITEYVEEYPVAEQSLVMVKAGEEGQVKGDDSVVCNDQNGIPMNLDVTAFWRVNPDPIELENLYLLRPKMPLTGHFGSDIATNIVRYLTRNAVSLGCSTYTYDEIYGSKKIDFQNTVNAELAKQLAQSHLLLDRFLVGEIYIGKDQQDSINKKATAQQDAQAAQYLTQKSIAEASAQIAAASGNAQSIKIIQDQLKNSPEYIEYLKVQKWNGQNPQVVSGSGGVLVQVSASQTTSTVTSTVTETSTSKK